MFEIGKWLHIQILIYCDVLSYDKLVHVPVGVEHYLSPHIKSWMYT